MSSSSRKMVVALSDCPARLVPVGTKITIKKDTFVTITQDLGGNYTVVVNGNMARVDGTDAAALGLKAEVLQFPQTSESQNPILKEQISEEHVWTALKSIYDPEIPVNLVDLGLIYKVSINQETQKVDVQMTLTAPGCGMGPVLVSDVKYRVAKVPNVKDVDVDLIFDPTWCRDMMSDEAKLETGMFF